MPDVGGLKGTEEVPDYTEDAVDHFLTTYNAPETYKGVPVPRGKNNRDMDNFVVFNTKDGPHQWGQEDMRALALRLQTGDRKPNPFMVPKRRCR